MQNKLYKPLVVFYSHLLSPQFVLLIQQLPPEIQYVFHLSVISSRSCYDSTKIRMKFTYRIGFQ